MTLFLRKQVRNVTGIFHLAGVLDDGILGGDRFPCEIDLGTGVISGMTEERMKKAKHTDQTIVQNQLKNVRGTNFFRRKEAT